MAKKITIAQLDIDIAALTKKSTEYLGQITAIKGEQKALRKSTSNLNNASKEELKLYTQKDAQLKKLSTEYNQQKGILAEVKTGVKDLSSALDREIKSLRDAQKNNSKLIKIRNQVNVKTKEGQKAISQINAKLEKNNALIRKNSSALEKQRLNIGNYGSALKGVGSILRSAGLIGGVAGLVLAFKGLFKIISGFQTGVSNLAAVLNKPVSQIKALSDNAIKLGSTTAKTAKEVLGLQEAYARLGFKQKAIIDLTKPTINASIAMNSNLADTANLAGAVVNSFDDLSSADAPLILDQITAATQNSALTFEKLQTGIPNVAAAASAAGVPFSKLLALLGKLADSGIDASKSSTSLRNIFIESAKEGLSYEQILEKIKGSQDKLTTATDEFGKRAAVSAIALSRNIDSTKELDLVIQGAAGTAQRAADTQLDNLNGAITLLSSGFDGFVLSLENGTGGTAKFVRGIIDATTSMFNFLTPVKKVSDGLIEERDQINLLVFKLGDLNLSDEERLTAINELNKVAPGLAETLDKQGIATEKTRKALDRLNKSFIANIALQIMAEEITKVGIEEAEKKIKLFEKETKVSEQLSLISRAGTQQQKDLILSGQELGKTNIEIARSLTEVAEKAENRNARFSDGNRIIDTNIRVLDEYALGLEISQFAADKAGIATQKLRDETEKLKQSFIDAGDIAKDAAEDIKDSTEDAVDAVVDAVSEMTETEAKERQKRLDKEAEANSKELDDFRKHIRDKIKFEKEKDKERLDNIDAINKQELEKLNKKFDDELEIITDWQAIKEDTLAGLKEIGFDAAAQLNAAAFSNLAQQRDFAFNEESNRVTEQFDTEIRLLKDKLEKGSITEQQFADKKKALEKQQAIDLYNISVSQFKADKKAAIGKIAIDTAIAIAKAISRSPLTFGLPWSAFAAAQGVVQAGVVAIQKPPPRPKFAKGTKRVTGDGSETSDSVSALLSKNERIVDAKNNRKIGFDMTNNQLATAANLYRSFNFNTGAAMNSAGIIEAIDKNTKLLKSKGVPYTSLHVTDGFKVVNKTKYLT